MKPSAHADFVMHAVDTFFTIIIHYFPVSELWLCFGLFVCVCEWGNHSAIQAEHSSGQRLGWLPNYLVKWTTWLKN